MSILDPPTSPPLLSLPAYILLFSPCRLDPLRYYLRFPIYLKVYPFSMSLHDLDLCELIIFEILTLKGTFFSLTVIKRQNHHGKELSVPNGTLGLQSEFLIFIAAWYIFMPTL